MLYSTFLQHIRPSFQLLPHHIFTRRTELHKTRRQRLSTWFCVNDVFFSYTCIASYVCTTESILSYLNWNLTTLCWCICKLWVGYYVCYQALRCRAVQLLWLVIIMVPCILSQPRLHDTLCCVYLAHFRLQQHRICKYKKTHVRSMVRKSFAKIKNKSGTT